MAHKNPPTPQQSQSTPTEGADHPLLRFYEENKRLVLGGSALIIIVVTVAVLVQSTVRAGEEKAWSDLYHAQRGETALESTEAVDEIDVLENELAEMSGKDAEPWAHYYLACRLFKRGGSKDDLRKALDHLETIAREFPDHYLMHASFLGGQDRTVPHMIDLVSDELAWKNDHPITTKNPDPSSGEQWAIETSQGTIVIELYTKEAPENCAAFRKLASSYTGMAFKTVPSPTFVKGGEPAGDENPLTAIIESDIPGFPPLEKNGLYHFEGAVSFEPPLPAADLGSGAFVICLDDSFNLDDAQTVFARVVRGLSVVEDIADAPKKENLASELAEPVSITAVRLVGADETEAESSASGESEQPPAEDGK